MPTVKVPPDPVKAESPKSKKVGVSPSEQWVYVTDGGEVKAYRVVDGQIVVDEAHAQAVLGAIQGSQLLETPAEETKSEAPTKE